MRRIYGKGHPLGHEQVYLQRYRDHNTDVRRYFDGRPDAMIEMRLERADCWSKLCSILGVPPPESKFPHLNRGARQRTELGEL
jgi:hypothetical protein